jgi:hypothetical protein
VNEAVQVYYRVDGHSEGQFVCECSDPDCAGKLYLRPEQYAAIRAHPTRFVVLPGHEAPDFERVVEEADGFYVVEKPLVP